MDQSKEIQVPNNDNRDSYDYHELLEMCQHEILNRKVVKVYWMDFSDRLGLEIASPNTEHIRLSFGPMHWELIDQNSNHVIASTYEEFETFRVPIERLVGTIITKLSIRPAEGLALTIYFDNGTYLQIEPCEQFEEEIKPPCWELFCSDGDVIKVGTQLGTWKRRPKTTPFWH
jgi:hypothetical protein